MGHSDVSPGSEFKSCFYWGTGNNLKSNVCSQWHFSQKFIFTNKHSSLADPGFGQGGPKNFFRNFGDVAKQAIIGRVQAPGSSCICNPQICILPLFLVLFLQNILCTFVWVNCKICISIWKILNILANAIFLFFIRDNKGSYSFIYFCLEIHYSVSWGSKAHLGPQKLSHFNLSNMHFPTFAGTFSSKIDVDLCRHIHKISFSI